MSYDLKQCPHCGKHSRSGKKECIWCFRNYKETSMAQHVAIGAIIIILAIIAVRLA